MRSGVSGLSGRRSRLREVREGKVPDASSYLDGAGKIRPTPPVEQLCSRSHDVSSCDGDPQLSRIGLLETKAMYGDEEGVER